MHELAKIREELDRTYDYQLKAEDAVLAQRRRTRELADVYAEARTTNQALPPSMRG
ncbi:hypothetical protein GCM10023340_19570 [Nocardioides marinquilinus]|uniref:Uncharacterized protein n=1 Tax=Nocardioides marinquilinus TaxID=1210400 RepID=A0ABP9PJU6_9ACTN